MAKGIRMRFLGIDPGQQGGIALLDGDEASAVKMPQTEREILDTLDWMSLSGAARTRAMIERVASSPQMGVVSAFTFGKGYGGLLMALTACQIPFDQVSPIKWQNVMECRTPRDRRMELGHKDKNINKRRAEQLFPRLTITHATADALLLAEYARRIYPALLPEEAPDGEVTNAP